MLVNISAATHRLICLQINGTQSKPAVKTKFKNSRAYCGGEIKKEPLTGMPLEWRNYKHVRNFIEKFEKMRLSEGL
jgi:hypothetical protein